MPFKAEFCNEVVTFGASPTLHCPFILAPGSVIIRKAHTSPLITAFAFKVSNSAIKRFPVISPSISALLATKFPFRLEPAPNATLDLEVIFPLISPSIRIFPCVSKSPIILVPLPMILLASTSVEFAVCFFDWNIAIISVFFKFIII